MVRQSQSKSICWSLLAFGDGLEYLDKSAKLVDRERFDKLQRVDRLERELMINC